MSIQPSEPSIVSWAGATHVGRVRDHNEDGVYPLGTGEGKPPLVFAVADGLGGEPAGDVASSLAIGTVAARADDLTTSTELVAAAEASIHRFIVDNLAEHPEFVRMATTLTLAIVGADGKLHIGHVGDSRLYLFNSGRLIQVTVDHSVAMELVRKGDLALEKAPSHPQWDTVTNWLGVQPARIASISLVIEPGDRMLLCTDGLTNMVPDLDITRHLAFHTDDLECAEALIDAANAAGGRDNTTLVVATIQEG